MKTQIILASHGKFASGILNSLQLICGDNQSVMAIDCYVEETFDLSKTISKTMEQYQQDEVVVVTDIFGGSVNNEFLRYLGQPNFYLISGLNLPLLIELVTHINSKKPMSEIINMVLNSSKEMIQFCNESVTKEVAEEEF
jgi:fructoselysine and glucoselysine-specific PTS system IIA component